MARIKGEWYTFARKLADFLLPWDMPVDGRSHRIEVQATEETHRAGFSLSSSLNSLHTNRSNHLF